MNRELYEQVKKVCIQFEHPLKKYIMQALIELKEAPMLSNVNGTAGAIIYLGLYPYDPISTERIKNFLLIIGYPTTVENIDDNIKKLRRYRNIQRKKDAQIATGN